MNGIDLTPVQDTPVALRKEDTYVHFNVDIEIQKHIERLTKGMWHQRPETGPRSFGSTDTGLLLSWCCRAQDPDKDKNRPLHPVPFKLVIGMACRQGRNEKR